MEIFEVTITDSVIGLTKYAQYCPSSMTVNDFCRKLVHLLLFTSTRVITVPDTSYTIDRINITSIDVQTSA